MGHERAVDVFFCTAPQSDQRRRLSLECLDFWKRQKHIQLYVISPESIGCSLDRFNRERRVFADENAKSDPYIVTDDDCIPICRESGSRCHPSFRDTLARGLETVRRHPDFAVLSFWPSNATIHRWTPEGYSPEEDLEVMEHVSVGGIRMCRKTHILYWPLPDGIGYDLVHADKCRSIGKRVGYFQHLRMVHLGEGKSDLWTLPQLSHIAAR